MPFATFKTEVQAPAELLWEMMLEKIERPDLYVPGVEEVKILQRFGPNAIEREMVARDGERTKTIHEYITADPLTRSVIFKLVDDPVYTGFVANVIFEDAGRVELDYTMHWTARPGSSPAVEPDFEQTIKKAVLHAKDMAEARAQTPT